MGLAHNPHSWLDSIGSPADVNQGYGCLLQANVVCLLFDRAALDSVMATNLPDRETTAFAELLETVRTLRKLCPWDRRQTVASTRPLLINEVYELDEALRQGDREATIGELGDYLFMGLFLTTVLERKSGIRLADVLHRAARKLRQRHPHVYGNSRVHSVDEVLTNWERLKHQERQGSILAGLPAALPALQQAQLMQERCRRVGFDWEEPSAVLQKIQEEIAELELALKATPDRRGRITHGAGHRSVKGKRRIDCIHEELGDLLFAVVNLCRHLGIDAEGALKDANRKFRARFERVEAAIRRQGREITQASLAEMEREWQRVKRMSKGRCR